MLIGGRNRYRAQAREIDPHDYSIGQGKIWEVHVLVKQMIPLMLTEMLEFP